MMMLVADKSLCHFVVLFFILFILAWLDDDADATAKDEGDGSIDTVASIWQLLHYTIKCYKENAIIILTFYCSLVTPHILQK